MSSSAVCLSFLFLCFACESAFFLSIIWFLSHFSFLIEILLVICSTVAPSSLLIRPFPSANTFTQTHSTQHKIVMSLWVTSISPISVPSCLTPSAAPYWLGFVTATSCAAVCLSKTDALWTASVPSPDRTIDDKEKIRSIKILWKTIWRKEIRDRMKTGRGLSL